MPNPTNVIKQDPRVEISKVEITRGVLKVPVSHIIDHGFCALSAKYGIPGNAICEIEIPGGGDCSGERIPADEIDAVITWETTRDVE